MCGRFYIAEEDTAEDLLRIIDALNRLQGHYTRQNARGNPANRHHPCHGQLALYVYGGLRHEVGIHDARRQTHVQCPQ